MDGATWRFESGSYEALGHTFAIRTTDLALGRYLDTLFRHFVTTGTGSDVTLYSLIVEGDGRALPFVLHRDDEELGHFAQGRTILAELLWHINRSAVRDTKDHLLLHASAAAWRGKTLIFPAPMESGKSTLVAGLVRAGFGYVTDEAVAIEPSTLTVTAFPRAISIDPGSWGVLSDLRPNLSAELERYQGDQWQVEPDSIRPGSVVRRSEPGFVITPRYRKGAETRLWAMSRSEAVRLMGSNAFNFQAFDRRGLRVLAEVARQSACYRLDIGELGLACELVGSLVGASDGAQG